MILTVCEQGSSTASKQKSSNLQKDNSGAPHKFHLDTFVGSEGQVKYTNKTGQTATRGPPQQQIPPAANNNMDSLEPDSVQQSTTKQLSRMNQQQISSSQ